jgi:release factor glutamine methyltransferase
MRVGKVLAGAARELAAAGVESPRPEAELLVASVLGLIEEPRAALYRDPGREVGTAQARTLAALVLRRLAGEPVQYVVGRAWFRDLTLEVGRGVLIPRPETEVLAGEAIAWLGRTGRGGAGPSSGAGPVVLDLGTGSGCIALAMAVECPGARLIGSELSLASLRYAVRNRARTEVRHPGTAPRVSYLAADGFTALRPGPLFDVVVGNPPYVAEGELAALPREVREHEPAAALVAGHDGLAALVGIVERAPAYLRPGGLLALEVGEGQADNVAARCARHGEYRPARIVRDLAGRARVVTAERRP